MSDTPKGTVTQDFQPAKQRMAGVDDARAAMLSVIELLPSVPVSLDRALGRTLADAVHAVRDQPPFDASAMDGYAVRAGDAPGRLQIVGESAAGRGFSGTLPAVAAVRISTGAPVPEGADAIVIQEDAVRVENSVAVPALLAGTFIRRRGGDFTSGTQLLNAGRRLDGLAVALAAAAGLGMLTVRAVPRIALLSSGDELAEPGETPGPFQIFDSATPGLMALVHAWGGTATRLPIARDDAAAIAEAAERGLRSHDLLVVVGGASVGDHDHAKTALTKLGVVRFVDKVAVRPGKPTWFGSTPLGPVLGLPGNPASALVCAHLFLQPVMEAMMGRDGRPTFCRARLADGLSANGPREHYLRGRLDADAGGQMIVRAFEQQDSSLLSVFDAANALVRMEANAPALETGALVDVLLLDVQC